MLAAAAMTVGLLLTASPAHAATASQLPGARDWRAAVAMNWAEHQAGCWYSWGGTSCAQGFDCSGLVYEAYLHAGIALPRTTYGMLGSWHLVRTYYPHRGDLAFYGSGHVELVTVWNDVTFGARIPGTQVGWNPFWPGGFAPTMYYYVR